MSQFIFPIQYDNYNLTQITNLNNCVRLNLNDSRNLLFPNKYVYVCNNIYQGNYRSQNLVYYLTRYI